MYCNKCGRELSDDSKICDKCGNILDNDEIETPRINQVNNQTVNNQTTNKTNKVNNEKIPKTPKQPMSGLQMFCIGTLLGMIIVVAFGIFAIRNMPEGKYYFDSNERTIAKEKEIESGKDDDNDPKESPKPSNSPSSTRSPNSGGSGGSSTGSGSSGNSGGSSSKKKKTEVEAENTYQFTMDGDVLTVEEAKELIVEDSENQKAKNTAAITKVEDKFIKDYNITAANLLEMDPELADSITEVFNEIYEEYPSANGYLTNITLWNTDYSFATTIAAFRPFFLFAENANSYSGYPMVSKMQLLLSARYFLNENKLQKTIQESEREGWFPANCTKYSPAAHELGHYLSFIAMMKKYGINSTLIIDDNNEYTCLKLIEDFNKGTYSQEMLVEAYQNYSRDYRTSEDFDEWRGKISGYALAKDNEGEYIYDETIAEAFHDVYLNGENAAIPSKYIIDVLKQKLER